MTHDILMREETHPTYHLIVPSSKSFHGPKSRSESEHSIRSPADEDTARSVPTNGFGRFGTRQNFSVLRLNCA
jgi:hypothetical protein